MHELMHFQIVVSMECLITHFTSIRTPITMQALMCCKMALSNECLMTNCTGIRSLTTMYALMTYKSALVTECLITHSTWIWMLNLIHITGISAFSTVYMKLFIQSNLVRTQKLNIIIHSERNNYFYSDVYINWKSTAFEELCYLQLCIRWLEIFWYNIFFK